MRSGFGFLKSSALSRVALVAAVGGALGACSSDTARFSENPFSNPFSSRQAAAVDRAPTGSVNRAVTQGYGVAPPVGQVTSQRLAPPSAQPMLQAAQAAPRSVPAAASTMVTGSIPQQAAAPSAVALATAAPVAATARAAGGWSAAGGSPVTVGAGDTINSISSRYGVPASALAAANGVPANSRLQPGSQLIIPVFNQGGASTAMMAAPATAAAAAPALTPAPVRQVAQAAQTVSDVPRQPLYSQRPQPAPAAAPVATLPRATAPVPAPAARQVVTATAQPPRPPAPVPAVAPPPAPVPVAAPRAMQTPAVDAARERARQQAEAARARAETVRAPAVTPAAATPPTTARAQAPAPAAAQTTRPAAPANADAEARVRAAEARAKAETERRQQAEARLKAEEERKQKAEAQAKARTDAQARAKAEAERKQQAESRPRAEAPAPRAAQQTGPGASANTTASLPAREEAKPAPPSADFRWPARGRVISGFTGRGGNEGINISVPEGTPVRAAEGGTVAYAGNELKGYGNLVLIRHDNGYVSAYAHNGELNVKRGERVGRGQVIARSGQSGNVSSPQLHFELRRGANPVDPMPYLNN